VLPSIIETIEKNYEAFITLLFSFTISPQNDTDALRSEILAGVKCEPAVAAGDFRACDGFNASDALGSINVPVLVLAADDDKLTPVKYGEFLANSIKKGELVTIQDAGHFSNLEKPAEVNRAIADFLKRIFPADPMR
jgi:pimeloyl-ACP methyl ester carboxylesterase